MDDEVPLLAATGVAVLLSGTGAAVSLVTRRAADGRLGRNHLAGIRTRSTMRSDAAWRAGHAAAIPLSDLSGGVFAASGLLALGFRSTVRYESVVLGGVGVAIGLLVLAARRAVRAASAAS